MLEKTASPWFSLFLQLCLLSLRTALGGDPQEDGATESQTMQPQVLGGSSLGADTCVSQEVSRLLLGAWIFCVSHEVSVSVTFHQDSGGLGQVRENPIPPQYTHCFTHPLKDVLAEKMKRRFFSSIPWLQLRNNSLVNYVRACSGLRRERTQVTGAHKSRVPSLWGGSSAHPVL